jgi:hypothetical protein
LASILCITLGSAPDSHAAPAPRPAALRTLASTAAAGKQRVTEAPKASPKPKPAELRRLKGREMSVPLVKKAREIINEHYKKPFGTDIEFELGGQRYVGRIEQHYHPPGGDLRPWGHHAGCSLFIVESAR